MGRIHNGATASFIRHSALPAGVLIFWMVILVSALSQLITIKPVLEAIPAAEHPAAAGRGVKRS